jgi:hypothetical protein
MNLNINIKRKFKINGKEYNSIEEMPDNIREIFKKAMGSSAVTEHQTDLAVMRTKILFNGTEYQSLDAMPEDARKLYEKVLKAAETGDASPDIDLSEISRGIRGEPENPYPGDILQPTKFESFFSPRTLITGGVIGALLLLLYYLWQSR